MKSGRYSEIRQQHSSKSSPRYRRPPLLDAHVHLDRYDDPAKIAKDAAVRGVFIIAVTNLPSHFIAGLPHVRNLPSVRLSLGLHPLAAADHIAERKLFLDSLSLTQFIGEVGLNF